MKTITQYQANDGTIFSSKEECLAHETLCDEIDLIMIRLNPREDDSFKDNDIDFIQQYPAIFYNVRNDLLLIAKRLTTHQWIDQSIVDPAVHPSYAGRIIDEISRPLSRAWYRIMSTDKHCREWQQPYFANLVE